jgi:hypothetical protein
LVAAVQMRAGRSGKPARTWAVVRRCDGQAMACSASVIWRSTEVLAAHTGRATTSDVRREVRPAVSRTRRKINLSWARIAASLWWRPGTIVRWVVRVAKVDGVQGWDSRRPLCGGRLVALRMVAVPDQVRVQAGSRPRNPRSVLSQASPLPRQSLPTRSARCGARREPGRRLVVVTTTRT